jgi:undecaprenyl-diphosphatase
MSLGQAIVLGIIQGLSEFLPISSSAHLYVVPKLLGWPYHGIAFDVALHWGTLLALLIAFWRDWWNLARDVFASDRAVSSKALQTWAMIAVASIPAAIAGFVLKDIAETQLRSLPLQAATLTVFGFLLWWVDRVAPVRQESGLPGWRTSLIMGFAQAISLVPGVSRSGVTITAGRSAGLSRVAAARFSFLLATPITFGAGLLELKNLGANGVSTPVLLAGVVSAAIVGVLAIRGLISWLGRAGFAAFFIYRVALALVIVVTLARAA